jgi:hypothetical protein
MPEIHHVDQAKHPPTLKTEHGAAWQLDSVEVTVNAGKPPESCAAVATWLVLCPWAHPFWSYYVLSACHLRPQDGCVPATLYAPGMTHEIFVIALDPSRVPDVSCPVKSYMRPVNFAGQWRAAARPNPVDQDRAAAEKVRQCVEEILARSLNPDTDGRAMWVDRFSDSNL